MNNLNLVNCEDVDDDKLREFRSIASWLASRLQVYRRHIADMQSEIERLTAERDHFRVLSEACRPSGNDSPELVPTWTPPAGFGVGKYVSTDEALIFPSGDWVTHKALGWLYPGRYETAPAGVWHVQSDDATYLGPNEVSQ